MGLEGTGGYSSAFTDKIPPAFDGHQRYASYKQDVELWEALTTLAREKRGPALVGRLTGEPNEAAKTLGIATITAADGVQKIMDHLDKSFAVDATNQLGFDLANFLDFTWKKQLSVEEFIAGFHTRLDKIASLNIDTKLKEHLLLREEMTCHTFILCYSSQFMSMF